MPHWGEFIRVGHRVLDPSILYWNPFEDSTLPDLKTCKERVKMDTTEVAHTSLEDAWDVILLLREKYAQKKIDFKVMK